MLSSVFEYIEKYNMIKPGDGIVVGVSGGADSLALIHILRELQGIIPMDLYIAHVDHGLRGNAAKEDALFVKNLAEEWGIDFFLKEAQVSELAKDWRLSEEEAGRRVRYDFFEEIRQEVEGQRIALAHHRDDQAETILHNIIRGTGLSGLGGMDPVRDGIIIRPLLEISRRGIETYCRNNNLDFREDHTNLEEIYTRNRIRHRVIPMIEEDFNPNFKESLVRMGDTLRDEETFIREYSIEIFMGLGCFEDGKVTLSLEGLQKCHRAIRGRVLRYGIELILGDLKGIDKVHIEALLGLIDKAKVGSYIDLPRGLKAMKDYESLYMAIEGKGSDSDQGSIPEFEYGLKIPGRTLIPELGVTIEAREVLPPSVLNMGDWCIYVDAHSIGGELRVRNRRPGDRIRPLGMSGTKKLKDFFIDKKVLNHERDGIPLIVDRDNIVWVVGYQMSHNYRVTEETERVMELRVSWEGSLPEGHTKN